MLTPCVIKKCCHTPSDCWGGTPWLLKTHLLFHLMGSTSAQVDSGDRVFNFVFRFFNYWRSWSWFVVPVTYKTSCKPHDPWTAFCLIHSLFASLECILIFTGSDSIFGFVNAFRVKKKTSVNNSHNVRKPFFKISKAYKAKAAVFKFLACCCWVDALKWEIISFLIFPSCT